MRRRFGQRGESRRQLVGRDRHGAGQVAVLELDARPDVDEHDLALVDLRLQIVARHLLVAGAFDREVPLELRDLREAALGDGPQREPELEHVVAGEPVADLRALALRLDEVGVAQDLEVLRDAGDGHVGLGGQRLDVARRLREEVEQLEAAVAGQRVADPGEEGVEALLEGAV